jgi:hypothetical protein
MMPRFYFHVRAEGVRAEDDEGSEHASVETALEEAAESAREIVATWVRAGRHIPEGGVVVTTESGAKVGAVRFRDVIRLM